MTFLANGTGNLTNLARFVEDEEKFETNTTVMVYSPNLTVDKTTLDPIVLINNTVRFNIVVTNNGDDNLTDVVIRDFYPTEFLQFEDNGEDIWGITC